jgi:hypothetical protein
MAASRARLNNRHQDMVRQKIQAVYLVNRLTDHVLGKCEMTPTQVRAAEILLNKSVSNAPTVLAGDPEAPLNIAWPLPKSPLDQ